MSSRLMYLVGQQTRLRLRQSPAGDDGDGGGDLVFGTLKLDRLPVPRLANPEPTARGLFGPKRCRRIAAPAPMHRDRFEPNRTLAACLLASPLNSPGLAGRFASRHRSTRRSLFPAGHAIARLTGHQFAACRRRTGRKTGCRIEVPVPVPTSQRRSATRMQRVPPHSLMLLPAPPEFAESCCMPVARNSGFHFAGIGRVVQNPYWPWCGLKIANLMNQRSDQDQRWGYSQ